MKPGENEAATAEKEMQELNVCFIGGIMVVFSILASTGLCGEEPVTLLNYSSLDGSAPGLDVDPAGKPLIRILIADKGNVQAVRAGKGLMEFELSNGCRSFNADISMSRGDGQFLVLMDEAIFFKRWIRANQAATSIEIPCSGISKLMLTVDGRQAEGGCAIWGNARIVMESGETVFLSDILKRQGKLPLTALERLLGRVEPEPETRIIPAETGDRLIEIDWFMQAEGESLGAWALSEIKWAREMAGRILKTADSKKTALINAELEKLVRIEKDLQAKQEPAKSEPVKWNSAESISRSLACRADYNAVRRCKRAIMLQHPAIDFSQLLLVDNPYTSGREWNHESRYRAGFMATPGGRLLLLDGLSPSGKVTKLAPVDKPAAFRRFDLSYDGRKVLFSMCPGAEKSVDKIYHLYEMNLDGSGLRQLTSAKYNDIDPVYMPDGNIAFLTDRSNTYGGCAPWGTQYLMARCNPNGKDIYLLSVGSEGEFSPSVLNDGRVIYTRWEYNDKALNRIQGLWTMNPDGTMSSTFYGNLSYYPDHLGEARSIPGTQLVVFNGMGHHNIYSGSIGVVDTREGRDTPNGLYKVTQDVVWAEGGDGPIEPKPYCDDYHGSGKLKFASYSSPFPLSEDMFLVSARTVYNNVSARAYNQPSLFKLYLMDKYGNHELIYSGTYNVMYAQPVRKRVQPPAGASMVKWPGAEKDGAEVAPGFFYSADVFEGVVELRKKGKFLRVMEAIRRTYTTGCVDGGGSPFGSGCSDALTSRWKKGENPTKAEVDNNWGNGAILAGPAVAISSNTNIKRCLGTVPIREDGSVSFYAPAGKALYFQLLDADGLTLHSMRSWVNLMPGERRGCVGCHEGRMNTLVGTAGVMKYNREPDTITPPWWGVRTLSYVYDIQPIFDRNCGKCHQGNGKGGKKLDLTLRPDPKNR